MREIAGVLVVAGEAIAELIDVALMPLDNHVERLSIAVEGGLHELGIGWVGDRHLTAGLLCRPRKRPCKHDSQIRPPGTRESYRLPRHATLTFAFLLRIVRPMLPLTRRQREILDYLNDFIQQHGYAPSLEEIGRRFGLSSLATVHKHLTNLQDKGFIKRAWNRSRSVELVPSRIGGRAVELPLLGYVAAGIPIEAVVGSETIAVPEDLVGKRDTYVLRVKGDSMIDEQIRDGDYVIVEDRRTAENGEMVIALLNGSDVTLKKLFREHGHIRLQPANPAMQPIVVQPDQVQIQGVVIGVMRRYS